MILVSEKDLNLELDRLYKAILDIETPLDVSRLVGWYGVVSRQLLNHNRLIAHATLSSAFDVMSSHISTERRRSVG